MKTETEGQIRLEYNIYKCEHFEDWLCIKWESLQENNNFNINMSSGKIIVMPDSFIK